MSTNPKFILNKTEALLQQLITKQNEILAELKKAVELLTKIAKPAQALPYELPIITYPDITIPTEAE